VAGVGNENSSPYYAHIDEPWLPTTDLLCHSMDSRYGVPYTVGLGKSELSSSSFMFVGAGGAIITYIQNNIDVPFMDSTVWTT
jgi:hypothetical protein